ncbi:hypothetical protein SNEBB_003102 [Seison nebaliae]|nr:hypothetical protein SNEBB_003102 [Seison nebaliae]
MQSGEVMEQSLSISIQLENYDPLIQIHDFRLLLPNLVEKKCKNRIFFSRKSFAKKIFKIFKTLLVEIAKQYPARLKEELNDLHNFLENSLVTYHQTKYFDIYKGLLALLNEFSLQFSIKMQESQVICIKMKNELKKLSGGSLYNRIVANGESPLKNCHKLPPILRKMHKNNIYVNNEKYDTVLTEFKTKYMTLSPPNSKEKNEKNETSSTALVASEKSHRFVEVDVNEI